MEHLDTLGWLVIAIGVVDLVLGHTIIAKAAPEPQRKVVVAAMTFSGLAVIGVGLAMVLGVFGGESP